jgi:predicted ATPase
VLAEAYLKLGQIEQGLNEVREALERVRKSGPYYYEPELHRLKGELLLRSDGERIESKVQEVEACFQEAIKISRWQEAKSLELRAVMSLSRLWRHQGKQEEAQRMLAETYGWFTEGFDTRDLQEAKALLNELS